MSKNSDLEAMAARLDAADDLPALVALRRRSYDLLRLRPGSTVVDVGTGTGRAVAELCAYGVRAVGIDTSPEMIGLARHRHAEAEFVLASACRLPFRDGEIRGYRADKVLHELPDPVAALDEAVRVLAPGGRIVLTGQDWEGVTVAADDAALSGRIIRARADAIRQPGIARAFGDLLRDRGLAGVESERHTLVFTGALAVGMLGAFASAARSTGALTDTESRAWLDEQRRRASDGRLELAVPVYVAAGTT